MYHSNKKLFLYSIGLSCAWLSAGDFDRGNDKDIVEQKYQTTPLHTWVKDFPSIELYSTERNSEENCSLEGAHKGGACVCDRDFVKQEVDRKKKLLEKISSSTIDINAQDEYGNVPLYYAVLAQNPHLINLLVQKGAKADIENFYHMSPMYVQVFLK